jgi:DNA-binding CsgD family transcriptional regulator
MNPLDFFKDKAHPKIKRAIKTVFEKGESKLFEDLRIKSGKYIPYYFEAYQFNMNDRYIFMGLAVEESIYKKNNPTLTNIKRQKYQTGITLQKSHMNKNIILLDDLMNKISDQSKNGEAANKIIVKNTRSVELKPDNIEFLKKKLDNLPEDFFSRLKDAYPDLTKSEIKFGAYIKMQLSLAEIALILGISEEGIKKKKYRIRKKFKLCRNDSLEFFILKF